eukprot:scaffold7453_cov618-Prasinococcus_capsulatus_cf.AAC.1
MGRQRGRPADGTNRAEQKGAVTLNSIARQPTAKQGQRETSKPPNRGRAHLGRHGQALLSCEAEELEGIPRADGVCDHKVGLVSDPRGYELQHFACHLLAGPPDGLLPAAVAARELGGQHHYPASPTPLQQWARPALGAKTFACVQVLRVACVGKAYDIPERVLEVCQAAFVAIQPSPR